MPVHEAHSLQTAHLLPWYLQAMTPGNIQFTYDQGAADAAAWLEANPMIVAGNKRNDHD
jgi:hypothetical protein